MRQQNTLALCFSELANCTEIMRSGRVKRCNWKILSSFGVLSTANTLKPRFLHALLNRQDPAKIPRVRPEPLLGSSSVPKNSTEALGAKNVELQKESHALTSGSLKKGSHAFPAVPGETRLAPGSASRWLHSSPETFSCQLARHFAVPCPAFKHFIQSCMPNLPLSPLAGLLQPFDMLKGSPAAVFLAKPASSCGN